MNLLKGMGDKVQQSMLKNMGIAYAKTNGIKSILVTFDESKPEGFFFQEYKESLLDWINDVNPRIQEYKNEIARLTEELNKYKNAENETGTDK